LVFISRITTCTSRELNILVLAAIVFFLKNSFKFSEQQVVYTYFKPNNFKKIRYLCDAFRVPEGLTPQDANRAADATVDKKCGRIKSKKRESSSTFSPKISERKVL